MFSEENRLEFHTFIKQFIKQIQSIQNIHIFILHFGLINGCCYDCDTLANYFNLTPTEISTIILDEAQKFSPIIHHRNYAFMEPITFILTLFKLFPLDTDYLDYKFYSYLEEITYIPTNIIFPFMVKLLSNTPPDIKSITQLMSSFSSTPPPQPYHIPLKETLKSLPDFMRNSLYEYTKLEIYANHPYFKDFAKVTAAIRNYNKKNTYCIPTIDFKDLIIWPNSRPTPCTLPDLAHIHPLRNIESDRDFGTPPFIESTYGTFSSNKLHREVCYDSSLEYSFYQYLEKDSSVSFYCEQPFYIPYTYKNTARRYLPDTLIILKNKYCVLVEIKPLEHMAVAQNLCKFNALKKYCLTHNYGYLICDGKHSLSSLESRPLDTSYVSYVLNRLNYGPIRYYEYKYISSKFNTSCNDFYALVIQNNLFYTDNPFFLSLR